MSTLDSLTTKMAKDKGYSGESPAKDGLRGFVCPRANAYGGREGIIPPGVAAQHGLVPLGMKRIDVSDTAKAANAARDDGKTEADRYREYYGARIEAAEREREAVNQLQALREKEAREKEEASVKSAKRKIPKSVKGGQIPKTPAPSPKGKVGRKGAPAAYPKNPGMFSTPDVPVETDNTLDGFYEGLKGVGFGTGETSDWATHPPVLTGLDLAETPAETVTAELEAGEEGLALTGMKVAHDEPTTPQSIEARKAARRSEEPVAVFAMRYLSDQNKKLQEELDRIRDELGVLKGQKNPFLVKLAEGMRDHAMQERDALRAENERLQKLILAGAAQSQGVSDASAADDVLGYKEAVVDQQRETIERLQQENVDLRAAAEGLERRLKEQAPQPADTVHVVLSAEERRIKIGGHRWACNILGALHFSRSRGTVVLSVSDMSYASDLIANIQNGPVVIVTEEGRTSCVYSGNFDKIYGEADSTDFIALFRFTCDLE